MVGLLAETQGRIQMGDYRALGAALAAAEGEAVAAVRMLALTGCRHGEVAGLKWSEVNLEARQLRRGLSRLA